MKSLEKVRIHRETSSGAPVAPLACSWASKLAWYLGPNARLGIPVHLDESSHAADLFV